jgi:hypothetical protein
MLLFLPNVHPGERIGTTYGPPLPMNSDEACRNDLPALARIASAGAEGQAECYSLFFGRVFRAGPMLQYGRA